MAKLHLQFRGQLTGTKAALQRVQQAAEALQAELAVVGFQGSATVTPEETPDDAEAPPAPTTPA